MRQEFKLKVNNIICKPIKNTCIMSIVFTDISTEMENNFNVTILKLQDSFGQKFDALDGNYGEIRGGSCF